MIQGVVLDVDDTCYLERDYVYSGFLAVEQWASDTFGVAGVARRAWELFLAGTRGTTITEALAHAGVTVDADVRDGAIRAYREHEPRIELLPDARDFLASQQGLNRKLAVITDGPADSQRAKCSTLGLFRLADPVVITADLGTSKPDPAVYHFVEDAWGLHGDQLVYVADNPAKDFEAPLQLGWRCVRVRRPDSLHAGVATPSGVLEVSELSSLEFST